MRKKLTVVICVLLVLLVPAAVFAVTTMKPADKASGSFTRDYVDRINLSITNTDFELNKTSAGKYIITFIFKAEKTEADFYGVINSLRIDGLDYDNAVFTPLNENSDGKTLTNVNLPVKNGKAVPAEYRADITFTSTESKINPVIVLDYTSGYSMLAAERHQLEIPLSVKIK